MKINDVFKQAFYLVLLSCVLFTAPLIAQVGLPSDPELWRSIGPFNPSGAGWDEQGQLNVVRFHPEYDGSYDYGEQPTGAANVNKNTIYAGSGPGGLFYSTDGGEHWQDFYTDELIYPGCSDLEIASFTEEGTTKYDYFYVHRPYFTGYTGHPSWHFGSIVYRKLHGTAWADAGTPFNLGNLNSDGYHGLPRVISDLAISPDAEAGCNYRVLVASNQGVHYSTDRGASWNAATFDDNNYWNNINWHSGPRNIMVDQTAPQNVYLTGDYGENLWGWIDLSSADANVLYRSTDRGEHFTKWRTVNKGTSYNTGLTMSSSLGSLDTDGFKIINTHLLQSESNPNRFFLMVLTETEEPSIFIDRVHPGSGDGNNGLTIFVSNNKGLTWEYGSKTNASGPYDNVFSYVLDPLDQDRLYIGRGNKSEKVTLYDHGTKSFQIETNSNFHPDARGMATKKIGDQTHLMVGHDGGIDISKDITGIPMTGTPSNSFDSHTGNIIVNRAYTISASQEEAGKVMIPMPDNSIMESSLSGNTRVWDKIDSGDGEHSQYSKDPASDAIHTQIRSSGYSQVNIRILGCPASNPPTVQGESIPLDRDYYQIGQKTWHRFPIKWVNWDAPDSVTPFKTFLGQSDSENGVHRILYSDEGGCGEHLNFSGFEGASGAPIKSRITHLEVEAAVPNLVIFAYQNAKDGMPNGNKIIYGMLTDVNTIEWKVFNASNTFPSESGITDMEIVTPGSDDTGSYRLYVSFSSGEVFSCYYNAQTDAFTDWSSADSGLPETHVNCLAYDRCSDVLFAGTDHGVYYRGVGKKVSGGTSFMWQYLGKDLPNVTVTDLELEPKLGLLYASTWGRGVYEKDVSDLICAVHTEPEKPKERVAQTEQNQVSKKNELKVYPNPLPSGEVMNLSLSLVEEKEVTIQLFSISGQLIRTVVDKQKFQAGQQAFQLRLDDYSPSFLIVRTTIGNETFTEKVAIVTASDQTIEKKKEQKEN